MDTSTGLATAVVRALDAAGVLVDNIEVRQPSLDDVFFSLTGGHIEEEVAEGARAATALSAVHRPSGRRRPSRAGGSARMTTTTLTPSAAGFDRPHAGGSVFGALADIWAMTRRNLVHISREPMQLSDVTLQPLLFTVLFVYIFGGAIPIPGGGSYVDFLLAGILALNLVTSTMGTAVGLSTDLHEGMIDRFRTLPMWRSAVLVGRSVADLLTSLLCALIVAVTGLVVGWRPGRELHLDRRRLRALAVLRLRGLVGLRVCGTELEEPGVGRLVRLHRALPADLRLQRHGAYAAHARLAAGHRELEPGERRRRRVPRAVGQPEPIRHDSRLADAAPGRGGPHLVGWDPGHRGTAGGPLLQTPDNRVGTAQLSPAARATNDAHPRAQAPVVR